MTLGMLVVAGAVFLTGFVTGAIAMGLIALHLSRSTHIPHQEHAP